MLSLSAVGVDADQARPTSSIVFSTICSPGISAVEATHDGAAAAGDNMILSLVPVGSFSQAVCVIPRIFAIGALRDQTCLRNEIGQNASPVAHSGW
jgi:hypothetical protein